jgi:cytochrome c
MKVLAFCGVIAAMALSLPATAADAAKGKTLFEACAKCHSITAESDSTLVGPTLKGIVGRKSASVDDFRYSTAMRNANLTWDEATIKEYISDPQAKVKGNRMALKSTFEPAEIDDIIAYLKTLK